MFCMKIAYKADHPLGNFVESNVESNVVAFNFAEQIGYSSTFFQLVFQLLATGNKHHWQLAIGIIKGNLIEGN